jgi:hypothetical protein
VAREGCYDPLVVALRLESAYLPARSLDRPEALAFTQLADDAASDGFVPRRLHDLAISE